MELLRQLVQSRGYEDQGSQKASTHAITARGSKAEVIRNMSNNRTGHARPGFTVAPGSGKKTMYICYVLVNPEAYLLSLLESNLHPPSLTCAMELYSLGIDDSNLIYRLMRLPSEP